MKVVADFVAVIGEGIDNARAIFDSPPPMAPAAIAVDANAAEQGPRQEDVKDAGQADTAGPGDPPGQEHRRSRLLRPARTLLAIG